MRTKNINPHRTTCTFIDGRNDNSYIIGSDYKGYMDINGFFVGLTIIYYSNGKLHSIGSYEDTNPNRNLSNNRRINLWKEYDSNGILSEEIIYIK